MDEQQILTKKRKLRFRSLNDNLVNNPQVEPCKQKDKVAKAPYKL